MEVQLIYNEKKNFSYIDNVYYVALNENGIKNSM